MTTEEIQDAIADRLFEIEQLLTHRIGEFQEQLTPEQKYNYLAEVTRAIPQWQDAHERFAFWCDRILNAENMTEDSVTNPTNDQP